MSLLAILLSVSPLQIIAADWIPKWKSIPPSLDVRRPPEQSFWRVLYPNLQGVAAVPNTKVAVAVGDDGLVLRSQDNGEHWALPADLRAGR